MSVNKIKIAVIGLGYVGLPLASELGKVFDTIGYDIDCNKIKNLNNKIDITLNLTKKDFTKVSKLSFSSDFKDLKDRSMFIITVPTPIKKNFNPDLSFLKKSSIEVGKVINKGSIIVYESTVYPGVTEEFCIPLIEKFSNLKLNKDFYVGFSPERINPGDKFHSLKKINKIISCSHNIGLKQIEFVYGKIIDAKLIKVKNIKIAESAKIIENIQRDVNIGLFNELSNLFRKLNIPSKDVFDAASSKWNFHRYFPGLVGGHCIGVDPYYLLYKARQVGFSSNLILAGRKTNDNMTNIVFQEIQKTFKQFKNKNVIKIIFFGATFKENCSDFRNSKYLELINLFLKKGYKVDIYDPYSFNFIANDKSNYNFISTTDLSFNKYKCCIVGVYHKNFKKFKNIFKHFSDSEKKLFIDLSNQTQFISNFTL